MEYIHYGAKVFDPSKCKQIRNRYRFNKPLGGFWASPVDAKYGWKAWCEDEKFILYEDDDCFRFLLDDSANVLHICNVSDLDSLPKIRLEDENFELFRTDYLDFEELVALGYDAIEVHISTDARLYNALYGWDMDSIVIMNPNIVKQIA